MPLSHTHYLGDENVLEIHIYQKKIFFQHLPLALILGHVRLASSNAITFLQSCESRNVLPT